ncbi:MAG: diguanylate cyclase, partial [Angelakisella sp.]
MVNHTVVCTKGLFPLLSISEDMPERDAVPEVEFRYHLENSGLIVEEVLDKGWILRLPTENKAPKWVRLTMVNEPNHTLGVVVDITEDTLNKRHIEYERDYDSLTNLLNRRAFTVAIGKLFDEPEALKVSALLMLDLDNLKYINDSYGHDCGDGYLRAAANAMKKLPLQNMLLARMSGDEFFIFIYGYDSKKQIRGFISELKQIINESYYILAGGDSVRVRCSAGVTWYPEDTTRLEDLARYADFAMYSAKNNKKGDFCEFEREDYDKNSYLLHSREELNKLIEHRMISYHFQPIVSAATGAVFAYEALMRSRLETLRTPLEILALARSQSKLYEIEKLTWFSALETTVKDSVFADGNCKIFINSVSNNILNDNDIEELRSTFQRYLHRIVLE